MNHHRVECYPHAAHHCHCLCVFMAYFGMEQSGCLILLAAPVGVHVRCARMVEPDAIQLAIRAQLAINRRAWHWSRFTWRWIFLLLRVACRLQHIFSVFSSFFFTCIGINQFQFFFVSASQHEPLLHAWILSSIQGRKKKILSQYYASAQSRNIFPNFPGKYHQNYCRCDIVTSMAVSLCSHSQSKYTHNINK